MNDNFLIFSIFKLTIKKFYLKVLDFISFKKFFQFFKTVKITINFCASNELGET